MHGRAVFERWARVRLAFDRVGDGPAVGANQVIERRERRAAPFGRDPSQTFDDGGRGLRIAENAEHGGGLGAFGAVFGIAELRHVAIDRGVAALDDPRARSERLPGRVGPELVERLSHRRSMRTPHEQERRAHPSRTNFLGIGTLGRADLPQQPGDEHRIVETGGGVEQGRARGGSRECRHRAGRKLLVRRLERLNGICARGKLGESERERRAVRVVVG